MTFLNLVFPNEVWLPFLTTMRFGTLPDMHVTYLGAQLPFTQEYKILRKICLSLIFFIYPNKKHAESKMFPPTGKLINAIVSSFSGYLGGCGQCADGCEGASGSAGDTRFLEAGGDDMRGLTL